MRLATSIPRMYADSRGLKHGDLAEKLIGIFFWSHIELGHGFLESWGKQLLNHFRATDVEVGLLFNFGPAAIPNVRL